jgi:hypothetical protein
MSDTELRDAVKNARVNAEVWRWQEKHDGKIPGSLTGGETWGLALIQLADRLGIE